MALSISKNEQDGRYIIKVSGEVDLYSSPELRNAVIKAISAAKGAVCVDLSEVPYMDSSGVATLVEGLKSASHAKRSFVILSPSTPVMKVLQLSRLDSVFEIQAVSRQHGE